MIKLVTYFYLFSAIALVSLCSKEPVEEQKKPEEKVIPQITLETTAIPAESALLSSEGGELSIKFTTNVSWTAQSTVTWMTVNPSSGSSGASSVTIKTSANTVTQSRNALVSFTAGSGDNKATKSISVTQKAMVIPKITLETTTIPEESAVLSYQGGEISIKFTTNVAWTAESSATWMTVNPSSGKSGLSSVTIKTIENTTLEPRSATVTFTAVNGNNKDTQTISVTQKEAVTGGNEGLTGDKDIINL